MSKKFLLSFLIVCAINVITCYLFCSMYRRNCDVLLLTEESPIRMFSKEYKKTFLMGISIIRGKKSIF